MAYGSAWIKKLVKEETITDSKNRIYVRKEWSDGSVTYTANNGEETRGEDITRLENEYKDMNNKKSVL